MGVTYCDTREQSSFRHPQKQPSDEEAGVVVDEARQGHDDPPRNHDTGEPAAGTQLLEDHVAGDLEGGVGEVEDGQAPVVLVRRELQVDREALDVGVSDSST